MSAFYIISGDDDFARKKRARETAAMLCCCDEPETSDLIEIIPGDTPGMKPDEMAVLFVEAIRTPPFLTEKKVIWMRHHPDLELLFAENVSESAAELFELLKSPLPPEIDIIIDGPSFDRRKSKPKALKNLAAVEIMTAARASDKNFAESRREVINNFLRKSGKRLAPDALQYLVEVIGGDSGTLANELEKLDCFTANAREISLADCQVIVSRTQEALSWEFTSAVVECNIRKALLTLNKLLSQKDNGMEIRLMAALSNEYQRLIQTRLAMKELNVTHPHANTFNSLPPDIKERFPKNPLLKLHPFRAFKTCEAALRFPGNLLAAKLTAIRDASKALVSGGGDRRMLLEQLAYNLCSRQ